MFWNTDDDFDETSFNDEQANSEAQREIRLEHDRIRKLPVMRKARQIYETVRAIVETFPEDDDLVAHYREIMLTDAASLASKISAAEAVDLYTLRMENAVLIKVAARNLLTQTSGLKMLGITEPHYLQVLRDEIEAFRLVFLEWVKGFDRTRDVRDDWGLFYH